MATATRVITSAEHSYPSISNFLATDPTDDDSTNALADNLARTVASPQGAHFYGGGSQPE
jgi:hypothetical protein